MTSIRPVPLSEAVPGQPFQLAQIVAVGGLARRLNDVGLRTGERVNILLRRDDGGMVISCGTARLAISSDVARRLLVIECKGDM